MYFDEYGNRSNPTIVLLHCAGVLDTFHFMYHLSSDYHLVVPHILGTGKEVHKNFNFNESVHGIVEIVEKLEKQKVYVIGHSLGANLALALVSNHKELFEKAIISSPMITDSKLVIKAFTIYITVMYPLLKTQWISKSFIKLLKLKGESKEKFIKYWPNVSLKTWQNYFTDGYSLQNLDHVKIPILLMRGTKEPKVIKTSVEAIKSKKNDCLVKVIENGNHGHPVLKAENFIVETLNFLEAT